MLKDTLLADASAHPMNDGVGRPHGIQRPARRGSGS
jgi:hypothetical protein